MAAMSSAVGMFGSIAFAANKHDRGVKDWHTRSPARAGSWIN